MLQQISAGGRIETSPSKVRGAAVNLKLHNGGSLSVMLYLTTEEVQTLIRNLEQEIHRGTNPN